MGVFKAGPSSLPMPEVEVEGRLGLVLDQASASVPGPKGVPSDAVVLLQPARHNR